MTTTSYPGATYPGSVLGKPRGDLRLKLRLLGEEDRELHFPNAKTAIGHDEKCHIRLQGPGSDPLHCLILHGAEQTVIRNWSPKTRLNGRPFDDALLSPGDLLDLGTLELEVVSDVRICPPEMQPQPAASVPVENVADEVSNTDVSAELERRLAEQEAARQAWLQERQTWEQERAATLTGLHHREAELAASRELLAQQAAELENRRSELEAQRHASLDERQNWEQEHAITSDELARRGAELATSQELLAQQTSDLEGLRTELEQLLDNCQAQATGHAVRGAELDRAAEDLANHRASLDQQWLAVNEARAALTQGQSEAQAALDRRRQAEIDSQAARSMELDHLAQDLLQQRIQLDQERASLAEARTALNDERTALDQHTSDIEDRQRNIAAQTLELQTLADELRRRDDELRAHGAQLVCREGELRTTEENLRCRESDLQANVEKLLSRDGELQLRGEHLQRQQAELATEQSRLGEINAALATRRQEIDQREQELCERNETLARREAEQELESAVESQQLPEPEIAREATAVESAEAVDVETVGAEETAAPLSNAAKITLEEDDIFARLRKMSLLKETSGSDSTNRPYDREESAAIGEYSNSEEGDTQTENNVPEFSTAELNAAPEQDAAHSNRSGPAANSPSEHQDHEDSVEAYMARLLHRLRGPSDPATVAEPVAPAVQAPVRRATEMVAELDQQAAIRQSIVEPEESPVKLAEKKDDWMLRPRRLAPEMSSDLRAMRELANMNTKAALDRHVQKRWTTAAIGKACVAGVAVVAGVLLMTWAENLQSLTFASGAVAMLVAVFWGLQSLILMKQLQVARRRQPEARIETHLAVLNAEKRAAETAPSEAQSPFTNEQAAQAEVVVPTLPS